LFLYSGVLATYVDADSTFRGASGELLTDIRGYFEELVVSEGDILFHAGEHPDAVYFVQCGEVTLNRDALTERPRSSSRLPSLRELMTWSKGRKQVATPPPNRNPRLLRFTEGACFGEVDFSLSQPRSYQAECTADGVVYRLDKANLAAMQENAPLCAMFIHHILLKSLSQTVSNNFASFLS
jgi:CRP-like cAMP-binding protein